MNYPFEVEVGPHSHFWVVIYIVFEDWGSEIFRKEYLGGRLVGKQTALT